MAAKEHPFLGCALAMMRADSCRICRENITHHEMLGDQVLAASIGGGKQMHRLCWERLPAKRQTELKIEWMEIDSSEP